MLNESPNTIIYRIKGLRKIVFKLWSQREESLESSWVSRLENCNDRKCNL